MRRLFAAIVLVCCSAAWAQETVVVPMIDAESFKFALTKARREVFDAGMALTGPEKDAFWNVYTEFEKEKSALDNRRVAVMKEYVQKKDQLTDEQAMKLVNDAAKVAQEEVALRVKYANKMSKAIPGILAARFYQLDSYITTAMTLDILDQMELLGAKATSRRP